jgi:hypothetical protein
MPSARSASCGINAYRPARSGHAVGDVEQARAALDGLWIKSGPVVVDGEAHKAVIFCELTGVLLYRSAEASRRRLERFQPTIAKARLCGPHGRAWVGARIRSVTRAELHKMVDELPETAVEGAAVPLRGIIDGPIDPDQSWFWTPEWQRKEHGAEADRSAGSADRFDSDEQFLGALDERSGSSDADV